MFIESQQELNLAFASLAACIIWIDAKFLSNIKTYHIIKDIHTGRSKKTDRQLNAPISKVISPVTWAAQLLR